jgi:hypothetical protein
MICLPHLVILANAAVAAHVVGADLLSRALNEFRPSGELEAYLDAAEIAFACRQADKLQALRFRPWAREAIAKAAELLEGAGAAIEVAGALHAVASPMSPLAREVTHAAHA